MHATFNSMEARKDQSAIPISFVWFLFLEIMVKGAIL